MESNSGNRFVDKGEQPPDDVVHDAADVALNKPAKHVLPLEEASHEDDEDDSGSKGDRHKKKKKKSKDHDSSSSRKHKEQRERHRDKERTSSKEGKSSGSGAGGANDTQVANGIGDGVDGEPDLSKRPVEQVKASGKEHSAGTRIGAGADEDQGSSRRARGERGEQVESSDPSRRRRDRDVERSAERYSRHRDTDRDRADRYRNMDRDRNRDRDRDRGYYRSRENGRDDGRDDGREGTYYRRGGSRRGVSNSRSRSPPYRSGRRRYRSSSRSSSEVDKHRSSKRSRAHGEVTGDRDTTAGSATGSGDASGSGGSNLIRPVTLKDIITANPGISMPEAIVRLNDHNTAIAKGLPPPPLSAAASAQSTEAATTSVVGGVGLAQAAQMPPQQQQPALAGIQQVQGTPAVPGQLPPGAANAIAALAANVAGPLGITPEGGPTTKPHRELYVGNLPPGITVPQLAQFMNTAFEQLRIAKDNAQNVVVSAWVSPDGHYGFVELRTMEDATNALACLNGLQVGSYALRIGRPKGYSAASVPVVNPLLSGLGLGGMGGMGGGTGLGLGLGMPATATAGMGAGLGVSAAGGGGVGVAGMGMGALASAIPSNAIMASNLPAVIPETQVKELFAPFGQIKAFNIIQTASGSTQTAALEFIDASVVDGVVNGMNGLDVAGHKLSVQRIPASSAAVLLPPTQTAVAQSTGIPAGGVVSASEDDSVGKEAEDVVGEDLLSLPASCCLCLANMTTRKDLADNELYEELMEDVSDECNKYGSVRSIVIPRATVDGQGSNGASGAPVAGDSAAVGRVFVQFADEMGAQTARSAISGRKFNGRTVKVFFYPESLFAQKEYSIPKSNDNDKSDGAKQDSAAAVAVDVDASRDVTAGEQYVPEDVEDLD